MIVWGLLIALCVYVVRSWMRWFRGEVKLSPPRWRSGIATIGFGSSTASLTVLVTLGVHASITGGLPYLFASANDGLPRGFLTALCGVLAALIGKGQLEVPTIISSLLSIDLVCGSTRPAPRDHVTVANRRDSAQSLGR
jgi:hypothetical protein